jgi:hypothetical protein
MRSIIKHLESAHADLVSARKLAALSRHESYEEIGDAIECVEAAFVWLTTDRITPASSTAPNTLASCQESHPPSEAPPADTLL